MQVSSSLNPQVVIIVPVVGYSESLAANLGSLLRQEYSFSRLICVTDTDADPAVPVIRELQRIDGRVLHICSGSAEKCSQKNHNLLAGIQSLGPSFEGMLVFCDSGHIAPAYWLGRLIQPLRVSSEVVISSGYHQVIPASGSVVATGWAICVLALNLVRRIPVAAQPWGGAMAMWLETFQELKISILWSDTIVDDVTLACLLKKNGIDVTVPEKADLKTFIDKVSLAVWCDWLTRQWAYLKFVFPKSWFALGLCGISLTIGLYLSTIILLLFWMNVVPLELIVFCGVYKLSFIVFTLVLRSMHPSPGRFAFWYPAFFLTMFIAGWCHARTWFSRKIIWHNITYTVAGGGKVVNIKRLPTPSGGIE